MTARKTNKQFVSELSQINPNIIATEEYINALSKITFKCRKCGFIWSTKPALVLQGRGCPECGKKKVGDKLRKTHSQFLLELQEKNPEIEVQSQYKGKNEKILVSCKICGNKWESRPHDLLAGHGCPKCGYKRQINSQRMSPEQFIQKLHNINANIKPLDQYYSNHTKMQFECLVCGRKWKTVPNSVLLGHGCPDCARSSTSFFEQVLLNAFRTCLGEDAVETRNKSLIGMELDILIPSLNVAIEPGSWAWHFNKKKRDLQKRERCHEKGYRLITIFSDYKDSMPPYDSDCITVPINLGNANWKETKELAEKILLEFGLQLNDDLWEKIRVDSIEKSKRKSHDEFVSEVALINPDVEIVGHYYDNSTKVELQCKKCQHKWMALPGSVLKGHGCPICGTWKTADSIRKTHDEFLNELKQINKTVTVLSEYKTSKEKVLCKCLVCGNEWNMSPNNLLKGQGCPKCGRKRAAQKHNKTQDQFVKEMQEKNPQLLVIGEYVNSSTKIKVQCSKCEYIWDANPMDILGGHGCPKCSGRIKRTNEEFLEELKEIDAFIKPFEEYKNANTPIKLRCTYCGYEWSARPHDLLRSKGCTNCRRKKLR